MAVYTDISEDELFAFIGHYDIGSIISCTGIAEGVENTNYLLLVQQNNQPTPYILTIFEKRTNIADLPWFLGLMNHVANQHLPVPRPITAKNGEMQHPLAGKMATLVSFLSGISCRRITPQHMSALGNMLGKFHLATHSWAERPNPFGQQSWHDLYETIAPLAHQKLPELATLIEDSLEYLHKNWPTSLPKGVLHGDLFPDNVFFQDHQISGVIDLYFAASDFFAYELAICMNAWCFENDGLLNATKARYFMQHYHQIRPLSAEEIEALPLLAQGAALRFLLTRLQDWLKPPAGLVRLKDPQEYARKLRFHQQIRHVGEYGIW
ncbi:MAG: homoserine kinase [Alphaproteobacteria bacterium]